MSTSTLRPPRLAELQRRLRTLWTEPKGIDEALRRAPGVKSWIADETRVPARTRLSVYSDGYFLRLLESLAHDFRGVRRALGEREFQGLIADFLRRNPSRSPNLVDLGAPLPGFLRSHPIGRGSPYLAELAALEWAVLESLYSPRLPPFDPRAFASASEPDWARARIILDPTVRLLAFRWPVERLWQARDLPERQGPRALKRAAKTRLLLYRDDAWVRVVRLGEAPWRVLRELARGRPLSAACASAQAARLRAGPAELRNWFAQWTASGVVKRIEFP